MPPQGKNRRSSRASVIGTDGTLRRSIARRTSIHDKMSSTFSKKVKRNFYGLDDEDSKVKLLWNKYSEAIISVIIVFSYYFFGFLYYYHVEDWTVIETLYFQTATLTTVGYGDYSPTSDSSRKFTMFYIFCGVLIVGRVLNEFGLAILDYAESKAKLSMANSNVSEIHHTQLFYVKKIFASIVSLLIVLLMGAIFYSNNEDWDFLTAFYFCVITTSTVGYGDTALTKESSRLFGMFYMLSSVLIVGLSVGNIAAVFLEMKNDEKRIKMLSRKLDFTFIRELDDGHKVGITKIDFLVAMLVNLELVDKKRDVEPWLKKFDLLDKKGSGVIDFDDAIEDLEQEQQERILDLERQLEAIDEQDDVAHFFQRFTSPTKTSDNSNAHIESGLEMTEADAYPSLEDDSDSDDDENDLYVISNPMRNI
jgi:voltage-gated potassium channel